jgi:ketosteroid isomerase-like protein
MVYYDENIVRQLYEAFNRGDIKLVSKLYAEDVVLHVPGRSQISGTYRGKEALLQFWDKQSALSEGTFKPQVVTVADGDGHILVISDIRIQRAGREYAWRRVIDFLMRESRVKEAWFFEGDQYTADEAFA